MEKTGSNSCNDAIVDKYQRKITYLRVSITDRCNLRCIYCMPENGVYPLSHSEIISYEDILRFVSILSGHGLNKVRITGGEPLIRKGVVDFVRQLGKIRGIDDISMTTNGKMLRKFAPGLYEAGLKRINISLDSLKEDVFKKITRIGGLEEVLKGINMALKIGMGPVKVNTVLIKGLNDTEIIDFVNFARDFELNLRFIEYMPLGGNITETIVSSEVIEKISSLFGGFYPIKDPDIGKNTAKNSVARRSYGFKDNGAVISFISPISEHFCEDCNRLRLTSSGKLRLCLFYDREYDVHDILREKNEEDAYNKIMEIVKLKPDKHGFAEKASVSYPGGGSDSMFRIGG